MEYVECAPWVIHVVSYLAGFSCYVGASIFRLNVLSNLQMKSNCWFQRLGSFLLQEPEVMQSRLGIAVPMYVVLQCCNSHTYWNGILCHFLGSIKVFRRLRTVYTAHCVHCALSTLVFMILYNKTNRCTNFTNLFWLKNEPLRVSGSSSTHHQEFIHSKIGTGICHTGL
jgi:hypothetical protein